MNLELSDILLACLNLIGGGIWWRLNMIDKVIDEVKNNHALTRSKLDDHCEDFELHALPARRSTDTK